MLNQTVNEVLMDGPSTPCHRILVAGLVWVLGIVQGAEAV